MNTYFLKFTDEAEAIQSLTNHRQEDKWTTSFNGTALDVIGTVYAPTGNIITQDGMSYPEQAPLPGFHVNLAAESLDDTLAPFQIFPTNPQRTFATDNSIKVSPKVSRVSPIEFKLLFTPMERIAITAATPTDPVLADFFSLIDDPRLQFVNLDLVSTQQAVGYLAQQGLIAPDRIPVILSGGVA